MHATVSELTLRQAQSEFVVCVARLIEYAFDNNFELTFGDAHRSAEECSRLGREESCHGIRLAVDLNLFKGGKYLKHTADHESLGAAWKSFHKLARWGGDWDDGNHYSFEWHGRK